MALNLGMLSNVYPGYLQGENNQATVVQQQEAAAQARMRSQEMRDEQAMDAAAGRNAAALSQLAQSFGVAAPLPPGSPPPMAPGQASVPAPPQNMPGPPDAVSAPPVPPMPLQVPPAQAAPPQVSGPPPVATSPDAVTALGPPQAAGAPPARPAPAGPPQVTSPTGVTALGPPQPAPLSQARPPVPNTPSGAQPPMGTVTPRPAPSPASTGSSPPVGGSAAPRAPQGGAGPLSLFAGRMTTEQLAASIIKANPGIEKTPRILLGAIQRSQALLAPDSKTELAALQIQQKIDLANQKFELGQATLQNKLEAIQQANQWRLEIEKLKQNGLNDRSAAGIEAKLDALEKNIKAQGERNDASIAGRKDVANIRARGDNVKLATKAGLKIDPSWDDAELQRQTAEAMNKKNSEGVMSDDDAKSLAQVGLKDPSIFNHLGYGPAGNQNRQKVWKYAFQLLKDKGGNPEEIAAARVAITGSLQEARTIGAQAGSVALGTKEIDKFAPLVLAASDKVKRTQYPTVNSIVEAAQKGTGGTEIITLASNIQALKNAYTQVLVRNGRPSDAARRSASEVIDKAWSTGQIKAAIDAMKTEAKGAGAAAREAKEDVTADVAGRAPAETAEEPAEADDPLGIR